MTMADASFQARLERINSGQSYVAEGLLGTGELQKIRQRQESGKAPKPASTMRVQAKKRFPRTKVIVGFIMGLMSFFGGSLGAFHATQGVGSDFDRFRPLVEAMGPVGMSALLAFFMLYVSGLRSLMVICVMVSGFYATQFAEPHMARAAPDLWTQIYSVEHADALKFKAYAQATQWGFASPPELAASSEPAAE